MAIIRNKQTGELKVVDDGSLSDYGLTRPTPKPTSVPSSTPMATSKPRVAAKGKKQDLGILEGRTIPNIGALIAGTAGQAFGPIGGAAAAIPGYLGGDVIRKGTRDLLERDIPVVGKKNVYRNPQEDIMDSLGGSAEAGVFQLLGGLLGKGLGAVAHPIAPFIGRVNKLLADSPAKVDIGALIQQFKPEFLQQMAQRGLATEAGPAYSDIATNAQAAAQAFKTHDPGIIDDIIPIGAANQFKRNLTGEISKHYGEFSGARIEGQKMLARLLKQVIEQQEPGVVLPNKIAGAMYKAQEPIEQILKMLPFGTGGLVRYAGGAPVKAMQKLIPQGGGYLNTLFPALFQGSRQE